MAINPGTQYPGKIDPSSADYPFGEARNINIPGDGTGTPWEAALVNDIFGFQQEILTRAGLVPSGNPERVGQSQYIQALEKVLGVVLASISEGAAGVSVVNSQLYRFLSFAAEANDGGGAFVGRTAVAKSTHDGVNVVSPTVPPVSAQPGGTLAAREANFRDGLGETAPAFLFAWTKRMAGAGAFLRSTRTRKWVSVLTLWTPPRP
jgi:hypothetical protein